MSAKITISILGEPSKVTLQLLQKLANYGYRLLFISGENDSNINVISSFITHFPESTIEVMNCSVEACWEADIIFILAQIHDINKWANKIRNVSTGKLIVLFSEASTGLAMHSALNQFLPYCKIVSVNKNEDERVELTFSKWIITGENYEAKQTLYQLFQNINTEAIIIGENKNETILNFNDQTINF